MMVISNTLTRIKTVSAKQKSREIFTQTTEQSTDVNRLNKGYYDEEVPNAAGIYCGGREKENKENYSLPLLHKQLDEPWQQCVAPVQMLIIVSKVNNEKKKTKIG